VTRGTKCRQCPSQAARRIVVDVDLNGRRRRWELQLCKWDWRALEAMFDSAEPVAHVDGMFNDGKRAVFLW